MKDLYEVLRFLGTIPEIDEGGCGIAALSCLRWLQKNQPEELKHFEIVYLYYSEEGRRWKTNQAKLEAGDTKDIWTPPHIAVRYKGELLDAGGKVTRADLTLAQEVSEQFVTDNIKYGAWNYRFSRFVWCPYIEHHLGISLKDVEKFQQR